MEQIKMKSFNAIQNMYGEKVEEIRSDYKKSIERWLKANELDGDVVRKSDGVKGRIIIERDWGRAVGYILKFYPYTKAGRLSINASGYIREPDKEYQKGE